MDILAVIKENKKWLDVDGVIRLMEAVQENEAAKKSEISPMMQAYLQAEKEETIQKIVDKIT